MDSSIKLQQSVKENSLDLESFITDLHKWEHDMKEIEKQKSPSDEVGKDLPPVRCKKTDASTEKIITDNQKKKKSDEVAKKKRISSYDYAAWDKFNVDKALESSASEDDEETPPARINSKTEDNKTNTRTSSLSGKERAAKLKDEGNKCYSNNRLDDAVSKYTQGMALDPTNAILPANRAMAYLKLEKYGAAEADCSRSLKHDSNYIKAYLRRGSARLKLGKLELAAEDFRKVLELEPWNKDAKKELENLGKEPSGGSDIKSQKEKTSNSAIPTQVNKIPGSREAQKEEKSAQNSNSKVTTDSQSVHKLNEKNRERGKKIKIVEVDSSKPQLEPSSKSSEAITPIDKLPHQRSQKPLKRIKVVDVPSEDSIPSVLPSHPSSKKFKAKKSIEEVPPPVKSGNQKVSPKKSGDIKTTARESNEKVSPLQNVEKTPEPQEPVSLPPVPRTSHQFSQDWSRLTNHQSLAVQYVKAIQPSFFKGLELESEVLVGIVSSLASNDFTSEEAISYLDAVAKSDGFSVNVMFLSTEQKKVFYDILEKCQDQKGSHSKLISSLETNLL